MLGLLKALAFQTRLIFAGSVTQGSDEARFDVPCGAELVKITAIMSGSSVAMLFAPSLLDNGSIDLVAAKRPTMLFFYGNGCCLSAILQEIYFLRRSGANILAVELPGYGLSGGKAGEAQCYDAADTALAYVKTRSDIDPALIVACGWSLGGAIAIDLASRTELAGLATFSTFTSIADIASRWFPILPARAARPFLAAQFASEGKIGNVKCPILIGHGRQDPVIPFSMSKRLAAAAGPVTVIEFDSDHNDTFDAGAAVIRPALADWLAGLRHHRPDRL